MSAYSEYLHASTDEAREEAYKGMTYEASADARDEREYFESCMTCLDYDDELDECQTGTCRKEDE